MHIQDIWMSQHTLRRLEQIPKMVEDLLIGVILPPITLNRCEDGNIQLKDGHHRLMAIWLTGRTFLYPDEYFIVDVDIQRSRFGKINEVIFKNLEK